MRSPWRGSAPNSPRAGGDRTGRPPLNSRPPPAAGFPQPARVMPGFRRTRRSCAVRGGAPIMFRPALGRARQANLHPWRPAPCSAVVVEGAWGRVVFVACGVPGMFRRPWLAGPLVAAEPAVEGDQAAPEPEVGCPRDGCRGGMFLGGRFVDRRGPARRAGVAVRGRVPAGVGRVPVFVDGARLSCPPGGRQEAGGPWPPGSCRPVFRWLWRNWRRRPGRVAARRAGRAAGGGGPARVVVSGGRGRGTRRRA